MTDIMEARRKGFEESFPTPYFVTFNRDKKGYYSQFRDSTRKRAAECYDAKWIGYNAALDSVCVELPYPGHWSLDRDMVIEAIERAGLKVK